MACCLWCFRSKQVPWKVNQIQSCDYVAYLYRKYPSTLSPATFLPTLIVLEWSTQIEPQWMGKQHMQLTLLREHMHLAEGLLASTDQGTFKLTLRLSHLSTTLPIYTNPPPQSAIL